MTKRVIKNSSKPRLEVRSVRSINMNCKNYMFVHKRLHIGVCDGVLSAFIPWDDDIVNIPVTEEFADSFENYECSFDTMFNLLAALLVKAGTCPF